MADFEETHADRTLVAELDRMLESVRNGDPVDPEVVASVSFFVPGLKYYRRQRLMRNSR